MAKRLWLIIAAAMIVSYAIYLSRSAKSDLDVEPHAREEIERALRR